MDSREPKLLMSRTCVVVLLAFESSCALSLEWADDSFTAQPLEHVDLTNTTLKEGPGLRTFRARAVARSASSSMVPVLQTGVLAVSAGSSMLAGGEALSYLFCGKWATAGVTAGQAVVFGGIAYSLKKVWPFPLKDPFKVYREEAKGQPEKKVSPRATAAKADAQAAAKLRRDTYLGLHPRWSSNANVHSSTAPVSSGAVKPEFFAQTSFGISNVLITVITVALVAVCFRHAASSACPEPLLFS
eukprot:gnl/MRDRNA2_/MRDRNA2_124172_c0_seq1.p1 gnl/MRDRNA2_/MRDRNA2_124172_c0~~gnl/MRDRNA2_/MRDRNA2_124172_c0_seq1.p1  ORF type:complete len:244 (+),score=30.33 gnl/MRDRNA2_/MRDRNA2_124172_c0_seq1:91-822(+)